MGWDDACLRQRPIIPRIPFMREDVGHVARLAVFHVLFDRVEKFVFGDLFLFLSKIDRYLVCYTYMYAIAKGGGGGGFTCLHLRITPPRNLNHHIQYLFLRVIVQGNIVPRGDDLAVLFDVDAVLGTEGLAGFSGCVFSCHDFVCWSVAL